MAHLIRVQRSSSRWPRKPMGLPAAGGGASTPSSTISGWVGLDSLTQGPCKQVWRARATPRCGEGETGGSELARDHAPSRASSLPQYPPHTPPCRAPLFLEGTSAAWLDSPLGRGVARSDGVRRSP